MFAAGQDTRCRPCFAASTFRFSSWLAEGSSAGRHGRFPHGKTSHCNGYQPADRLQSGFFCDIVKHV